MHFPAEKMHPSTPNMTGRRFHRTIEMIPRPPLVVENVLCFQPYSTKYKTRERKGYERGTALLQSFPLSGAPVVQSYWAWNPAEKSGFRGAHGRKPQVIAGGLQGSRIKNASQANTKSKLLKMLRGKELFFLLSRNIL